MAQKKVGELIKEARTKAGLSQEKLASMVDGLSSSEVSKAERGEKELTQAELKGIAKATGVTQKSLLEAAGYVSSTAKKPASSTAAKTSTAKKTTAKTTAEIKLTAAEKRVLELYRAASAALRKDAEAVLKGEKQVQSDSASPLVDGLMDILSSIGKK